MQARSNKKIIIKPFNFKIIHEEIFNAWQSEEAIEDIINHINQTVPIEQRAAYLLAISLLDSLKRSDFDKVINRTLDSIIPRMYNILFDMPKAGFNHTIGPFLFILTIFKENLSKPLRKEINQYIDLGNFKKSEKFSTDIIINHLLDDLENKQYDYLTQLLEDAYLTPDDEYEMELLLLRVIGVHYLTHELRQQGSLGPSEIQADMKTKFGKWSDKICETRSLFGRPSHLTKVINSIHFADITEIEDKVISYIEPSSSSSVNNNDQELLSSSFPRSCS